jgi:hypothetical protein
MYLRRWLKHWGVIGGRQLRLELSRGANTYPGYLQPRATKRGDGFYWLLLAPHSHVFRSRFHLDGQDSSGLPNNAKYHWGTRMLPINTQTEISVKKQ